MELGGKLFTRRNLYIYYKELEKAGNQSDGVYFRESLYRFDGRNFFDMNSFRDYLREKLSVSKK